jgi:hypothetical protein
VFDAPIRLPDWNGSGVLVSSGGVSVEFCFELATGSDAAPAAAAVEASTADSSGEPA